MDPTTQQYAVLVTNLGVAGFMALMMLRWYQESNKRLAKEAKERAEQDKAEAERCRQCMDQHRQDYQAMLDKVLVRFEESTRFEQSVANHLSTLRRMDQIERLISEGRRGADGGDNRRSDQEHRAG